MTATTTGYRWISYTAQNIPGNVSSDLDRHPSLESARDAYRAYCRAVGTDDADMRLYPYSAEDWASAEELRDAGCPFDYPSRIIERGPLGGVVTSRT